MSELTYRFSEGVEEQIKEVQGQIQNILDLREAPTEEFVITTIMSLGLSVIRQNIDKDTPMQYAHRNNFRDFISRIRRMYLAQDSESAEMGNKGA